MLPSSALAIPVKLAANATAETIFVIDEYVPRIMIHSFTRVEFDCVSESPEPFFSSDFSVGRILRTCPLHLYPLAGGRTRCRRRAVSRERTARHISRLGGHDALF